MDANAPLGRFTTQGLQVSASLSSLLRERLAFEKLYQERDKLAAAWVKKNEFVNASLCKEIKTDEDEARIFELLGFNVGWSLRGEIENARLSPYLTLMGEMAEALEKFSAECPGDDHDHDHGYISLTKLRTLLSEKVGG